MYSGAPGGVADVYSGALGGLGRRVQWSTGWTRPACTVEHSVDLAGVYSRALWGD